jgi:hypothetical protein
MAQLFDRRFFLTLMCSLATGVGKSASAKDSRTFDGTWGGAQNGVTAQVTFVGATLIGFYWRNDYIDADNPKFSENGRSVSFVFRGGTATLRRTGEETATIEVAEGAKVTRLDLKRD